MDLKMFVTLQIFNFHTQYLAPEVNFTIRYQSILYGTIPCTKSLQTATYAVFTTDIPTNTTVIAGVIMLTSF